jgi:hypothetical protein
MYFFIVPLTMREKYRLLDFYVCDGSKSFEKICSVGAASATSGGITQSNFSSGEIGS